MTAKYFARRTVYWALVVPVGALVTLPLVALQVVLWSAGRASDGCDWLGCHLASLIRRAYDWSHFE